MTNVIEVNGNLEIMTMQKVLTSFLIAKDGRRNDYGERACRRVESVSPSCLCADIPHVV